MSKRIYFSMCSTALYITYITVMPCFLDKHGNGFRHVPLYQHGSFDIYHSTTMFFNMYHGITIVFDHGTTAIACFFSNFIESLHEIENWKTETETIYLYVSKSVCTVDIRIISRYFTYWWLWTTLMSITATCCFCKTTAHARKRKTTHPHPFIIIPV